MASLLTGACGAGVLQTAKTTPAGQLDFTVGLGFLHNEMAEQRGYAVVGNVPLHLAARYGFTDHLDVGLSVLLGAGAIVDAKYNLLPPEHALGLGLSAGVGAAWTWEDTGSAIHVPVRVHASYRVYEWLSPYVAVGYGSFWIFGRANRTSSTTRPDDRPAAREGYGDGNLMLTAGAELMPWQSVGFAVEYNLWLPVVDDPGDAYSFAANHILLAGVKF